MNISDEIKRLHELHQAGALTDLEFEQAKAKLLSTSTGTSVNLNKSVQGSTGSTGSTGNTGSGIGAGNLGGNGGSNGGRNGGSNPSVADDFVSEVGRLRRSRTDRMLGGVCGGIARVSGIESWIWRLMFVLCTVFAGFGLLFYVLMWIFVPEE